MKRRGSTSVQNPGKDTALPFEFSGVERLVACLLDNALKFTPIGKSVLLTVKPYFWGRRLREKTLPWSDAAAPIWLQIQP